MATSPVSGPGVAAGSVGAAQLASSQVNRDGLRRAGLNYLAETYPIEVPSNQIGFATGVAYANPVGLRSGDVVTNLLANLSTFAAGTVPTLVRLGIANSAGTMLALTADVKSDAQWTAAQATISFPLSAPLTIPADGLYHLCIFKNGVWGTTDPQLLAQTATGIRTAVAGGALPSGNQSGLTDLPAVSSALVLSANNSRLFWLACN